jgi:hypothetical protein
MGWINTYTDKPIYAEGLTGWFFFSMVASVRTTYLQISSLKAEDTAIYYCARTTAWIPRSEGVRNPKEEASSVTLRKRQGNSLQLTSDCGLGI